MPQIGDILLTLGPYRISQMIASLTREIPGDAFSHAALVITEGPLPLVIESVPPRTRVVTYTKAVNHAKNALLLSPQNIPPDVRIQMAEKALDYEGAMYGFDRYVGAALDILLDSEWCSQHLYLSKRIPYCSVMVAAVYDAFGYDFGEPAQGVWPSEIFAFAANHPDKYTMTEVIRS